MGRLVVRVIGDDPGTEGPRGCWADLPVDDETDLVGAGDVEVVADGLLEGAPTTRLRRLGRSPISPCPVNH